MRKIYYNLLYMIRYHYKFPILSCMYNRIILVFIIIVFYCIGQRKECILCRRHRTQTLAQENETSINYA